LAKRCAPAAAAHLPAARHILTAPRFLGNFLENSLTTSAKAAILQGMAIPQTLFNDIRGLQRKPSEWFFIDEIKHRDRGVDLALSWISKLKEIGTDDKDVTFQNAKRDLYDKLEDWQKGFLKEK
jgi:hypothetical protein